MSDKRTIVCQLATTIPNKVLEVAVSYDIGGANYFSGGVNRRGYYLSVTPVEIGNGFRTYGAFTGIKDLMEEATRFNKKRLDVLVAAAKQHPTYQMLVDRVLTKNNLELKSDEAQAV